LFGFRLIYVDSGDHGSLLPSRRPKSKPITPWSMCEPTVYRSGPPAGSDRRSRPDRYKFGPKVGRQATLSRL
jgi:hypothetical protein